MIKFREPWRRRGLVPFLTGSFVSNVGTEITGIALPLVAITLLNASNAWVATIEATAAIVMLVVALPVGVLVDRINRKSIMVAANLLGAGLVISIPLLWTLDHLTVLWLLIAAVALQVLGAVHDVATDTVMPAIVPNRYLDKTNGFYASSRSVAEVGGAGIGGIIISAFGLFAGMVADGVSFLISAVLISRLPKRALQPEPDEAEADDPTGSHSGSLKRLGRDFLVGFRVYWNDNRLRLILASSVTSNVFSTVAATVEFLFLIRQLQVPAWGVGLAVSVTAVGGLLGGVLNDFFVKRLGPVRVMVFTQLVLNIPVLLIPLAFPGVGVGFYVIGWFFYAMSSVVYASAVITYRQRVVPRNMLGRVGATSRWINSFAIGAAAVGTAIILVTVPIWPVVLVSSIGIYASGFWLLNHHFLRADVSRDAIGLVDAERK